MPMSRTCLNKEPLPPGTSCTDTWNSCVILRAYDCVLLLSHPPWQQCKPNLSETGILDMKRACSVDRPTLETRVDLNILKIQSNKWIGLVTRAEAPLVSHFSLLGRSFPGFSFVNNRKTRTRYWPPQLRHFRVDISCHRNTTVLNVPVVCMNVTWCQTSNNLIITKQSIYQPFITVCQKYSVSNNWTDWKWKHNFLSNVQRVQHNLQPPAPVNFQ